MSERILSQHGNVIAADFRRPLEIDISFKSEWLFVDGRVALMRIQTFIEGKPWGESLHVLADLATGRIATL